MMPSELYLPTYSYSPEEIFKGKILLFNVNFFREPEDIKPKMKTVKTTEEKVKDDTQGYDTTTGEKWIKDLEPRNRTV